MSEQVSGGVVETSPKQEKLKRGRVDIPCLVLVLLLLCLGLLMLLSASFVSDLYESSSFSAAKPMEQFINQLKIGAVGLVLMFAVSYFPLTIYRRFNKLIYYFCLFALIAVLVFGVKVNGSKRWIDLGFFQLQPSELMKIAIVFIYAEIAVVHKNETNRFKYGVLIYFLYLIPVLLLLYKEPHFSCMIIFVLLTGVMMFLSGTEIKWFIIVGVVFIAGALLYIKYFSYASDRISAWLDYTKDSSDTGYQVKQSLYAIGSGGIAGLGFGKSRQKMLYLPEQENDYIFSIICEELGLIGAILVMLLFALLIVRCIIIAGKLNNLFERYTVLGITSLLAIQVILNMMIAVNLLPSTGVALPFFSKGGTALLMQLVEMGVILSASRNIKNKVTRNQDSRGRIE